MVVIIRWLRLISGFCFFALSSICAFNYQTSIYLLRQAKGQLSVLLNTVSVTEFGPDISLTMEAKKNLMLIEKIKGFSVDSLGFLPTKNFTTIFNQHHSNVLWVITACDPYEFKPYYWRFPIVGDVSYKGFFNQNLAEKEYHHLRSIGYDVDIRAASAWSTLGWFNDPLLSSMLYRKKGSFCNLLFHELFHATYYAPGSVDLNENLANFVANKATLMFLENDAQNRRSYLQNNADNDIFINYILRKKIYLQNYYLQIENKPDRLDLKMAALIGVTDSIGKLTLNDKNKFMARKGDILKFKNAYFVDFQQYESMQDSLEKVFNKIYSGDLKKLVRALRLNKINS